MEYSKVTTPVRVGLIGCGGIAYAHTEAYSKIENVKLTAAFDTHRPAAESLAATFNGKAFDSIEALADAGVDAVSICTPPGTHLRCVEPFLKRGIAVMCEKPLAATLADAEALSKIVRAGKAPFMIGFCHRYHGPIIELKKLIDQGTLGNALMMRVIFAGLGRFISNHRVNPALSGGGCLIDNGAHAIDLVRFLAGEPTQTQAMIGKTNPSLAVEDVCVMQLTCGNGALIQISSSYAMPAGQSTLEFYGSEGSARVPYGTHNLPDLSYRLRDHPEPIIVDCTAHPDRFFAELSHFIECVRTGAQPAITADDGLQASRIVDAAYRSATISQAIITDY